MCEYVCVKYGEDMKGAIWRVPDF